MPVMHRRSFLQRAAALLGMLLPACHAPTCVDALPPAAPDFIRVTGSLSKLTVSWQAVTTNLDGSPLMDLAGYRIYRSRIPASGFAPIGNTDHTRTVWEDRAVQAGEIWYYKVTAFDTRGNESPFSPESLPALLSIRVPRALLPPPRVALFLNYDGQVAASTDLRSDLSITRLGDTFIVLSRFCTHAGCSNMVFQDEIWTCRCHGSQFTQLGKVITPPAQTDLRAFDFVQEPNGDLIVSLC